MAAILENGCRGRWPPGFKSAMGRNPSLFIICVKFDAFMKKCTIGLISCRTIAIKVKELEYLAILELGFYGRMPILRAHYHIGLLLFKLQRRAGDQSIWKLWILVLLKSLWCIAVGLLLLTTATDSTDFQLECPFKKKRFSHWSLQAVFFPWLWLASDQFRQTPRY